MLSDEPILRDVLVGKLGGECPRHDRPLRWHDRFERAPHALRAPRGAYRRRSGRYESRSLRQMATAGRTPP